MRKSTFAILFFALLIVVFATQNALPVQITFFKWHFSSPLSLIILISFILGSLFSFISSYIMMQKNKQIINEKDVIIKEKDNKIAEIESLIKNAAPYLDDIETENNKT